MSEVTLLQTVSDALSQEARRLEGNLAQTTGQLEAGLRQEADRLGAAARQGQEATLAAVGGALKHIKGQVATLEKGAGDPAPIVAALGELTQAVRNQTKALELLLEREAKAPQVTVEAPRAEERPRRKLKVKFSEDGDSASVEEV